MTVPSYTEEDVELVAEATEQHHIEFGITDAMGNNPCSCGQWWDAAGDNPGWDQHMAEVALAALAAAGRLIPPGSETRERIAATAETLHVVAEWGDVGGEELHRVAEEVATGRVADWMCCPVCEEIACDAGCPLAPVRSPSVPDTEERTDA